MPKKKAKPAKAAKKSALKAATIRSGAKKTAAQLQKASEASQKRAVTDDKAAKKAAATAVRYKQATSDPDEVKRLKREALEKAREQAQEDKLAKARGQKRRAGNMAETSKNKTRAKVEDGEFGREGRKKAQEVLDYQKEKARRAREAVQERDAGRKPKTGGVGSRLPYGAIL